MTQNSDITELTDLSYAEMERLGMPMSFINDYQDFKRAVLPQTGIEATPEGVYRANLSGYYIKTNTPVALWFNPTVGAVEGWIQLA